MGRKFFLITFIALVFLGFASFVDSIMSKEWGIAIFRLLLDGSFLIWLYVIHKSLNKKVDK